MAIGVVKLASELLSEFDSILCSSGESVSLKERREWWGARAKLDKQLKVILPICSTNQLKQNKSSLFRGFS